MKKLLILIILNLDNEAISKELKSYSYLTCDKVASSIFDVCKVKIRKCLIVDLLAWRDMGGKFQRFSTRSQQNDLMQKQENFKGSIKSWRLLRISAPSD